MPTGLRRFQQEGDDHFLTFSCYHRLPYRNTPTARGLFLRSLEQTRKRYRLQVLGYVVMPEHVHLLLSEPETEPLSKSLQALKVSVSKLSIQRPFWQIRYHDFNGLTHNKRIEKLHYMHQNPVSRGLAKAAEDWQGSSCRYYSLRPQPSPNHRTLNTEPWTRPIPNFQIKDRIANNWAGAPKTSEDTCNPISQEHRRPPHRTPRRQSRLIEH